LQSKNNEAFAGYVAERVGKRQAIAVLLRFSATWVPFRLRFSRPCRKAANVGRSQVFAVT
jgi:hypothetical protein